MTIYEPYLDEVEYALETAPDPDHCGEIWDHLIPPADDSEVTPDRDYELLDPNNLDPEQLESHDDTEQRRTTNISLHEKLRPDTEYYYSSLLFSAKSIMFVVL